MNQENNSVTEIGEIVSDFKFSHEYKGENFYKTELVVKRESGNIDIIPVIISDRIFNIHYSLECRLVKVTGSIRTFNEHDNNNHLSLSLYAEEIIPINENDLLTVENNIVILDGYICKKNYSRTTPFGRTITDAIIAVNRQYHKTDYIPIIVWSKNAIYMNQLKIGEHIRIEGRLQSREYLKNNETYVTYEVSVQSLEKIEDLVLKE